MTSRDASSLHRHLARHHRAVLNAWAARFSLPAAAVCAAAITVAVLIGVFVPLGEAAARVRLLLVIAACAGCLVWAVRRFRARAIGFDAHLEQLEQRFPEIRSWLRNALDLSGRTPQGTSEELAQALSDETVRRLDLTPIRQAVPALEPRRPALLFAAGIAVLVLVGLLAPERAGRSWSTLWNPALAAPPIRLAVEPGSVKITPGAALTVHARVSGTDRVPRLERKGAPAVAGVAENRGTGGERVWRFDLTQLTREQDYRVRVAHVQSPLYRIALAGEPVPVGFHIEYEAPAYSRLPIQRGAATRGDLAALRGTKAAVEVTFDRDLEDVSATVPGAPARAWKQLTARRWRGEILIDREGEYRLDARAASGQSSFRYRLSPLADQPPVIAVRTPGGDLDLPAGQQVPVEILGQDDLGLSELRLHYRKNPEAPWSEAPLARFAGEPREANVATRWDASQLGLLPGESASFRFELIDGNRWSGRGRTLSPTFELRFPSLADLYENLDQTQGNVQKDLEKTAEQARELQKSLEKLARQQNRSSNENPSFERSEEMKSAIERQQEIADKIEQAAKDLSETLDKASERQAFNEELTRKLEELSKLMNQIQSPEFKEAMRRMQQALERMDRQALENQLPQWKEQSKEMLANLERSIELMKQLRQEEQLDALAKRAEELKKQQDALNREHEGQERAQQQRGNEAQEQKNAEELAKKQESAAEQSEQLSKDAREMAQKLERESKSQEKSEASEKLEKAAEQLEKGAAQDQRDASKSAAQQQASKSKQSGQSASEKLDQVAQQMQQMVESMRQEREGVNLAALRRAAQDLVSLQREAEGNLGSESPLNRRADRQTDLSEGASRVADSLYQLARKTPFISPQLAEALGRAINSLSSSGKEFAAGNRARGEESGKTGGSALNQAVLELRKSESAMCQMPGGNASAPKPGASQQLGELGERQSQLNQQTRSLAQKLSEQMRLSSGDQQQLQRYAQEQRRLREQLEQIQKDDETRRELLGRLDQTKREMKEVEERLEGGSTGGDLEEKQNRILSRLLDASRSVHRRDFDPQRESRIGEDVARSSAPELSSDLLRENDRLRLDLLKAEADRYPAQYRAFIEAYLRRLNGSRR